MWCDNNFYGCYTPIEPYIYTLHKADVIFWYANQPQVLSSAGTFVFYPYVSDSSAGLSMNYPLL